MLLITAILIILQVLLQQRPIVLTLPRDARLHGRFPQYVSLLAHLESFGGRDVEEVVWQHLKRAPDEPLLHSTP